MAEFLLKTEAAKLSNNQLERGVIEEFIERDALWEFLPFMRVNSKAYVYNREKVLAGGAWLPPNTDVPRAASEFSTHTAYLKTLIGDVDVDKFLDATYSDTNSQLATQIGMKAKGMARQYKNALINGDISDTGVAETSASWVGLKGLAEGNTGNAPGTEQVLNGGAAGTTLSLADLDELIHSVHNGADALIMNAQMYRRMRELYRAAGGTTPQDFMIENFGMLPAYDGTPIILNDYILQDQGTGTDCSNIYAVRFNVSDGLHGIFGGENAGFSVEDIGTVQNRDATRTRIKFYNGLCLKSTRSLAVLQNFK